MRNIKKLIKMTAKIISGKEISDRLKQELTLEVSEIKKNFDKTPTLAVILVGNDPASQVYVGSKEKAAHKVGMNSIQFKMAEDISQSVLTKKIQELNNDENVHGILVQLPLPKHLDAKKVIYTIDPKKDVDGFHIINAGKLAVGDIEGDEKAMIPCTPLGSLYLIKEAIGSDDLSGKKVLVIGSSNIVGAPLARLLMLKKATVSVANSSTKNLKNECLQADIIISAVGRSNLITADMIKEGAIIIDVGINRIFCEDGTSKIVGDIDFENVKKKAFAITPVPGGVGPMTIAFLLKNTVECFYKLNNK